MRAARRTAGLNWCLAGCMAALLVAETATAQAPPEVDQQQAAAHVLPVQLPLTGTADTHLKQALDRILSQPRPPGSRPLVILEFREASGNGAASEFERCLSLARYLTSDQLRAARLVAYLPQDTSGHAVLVVLACEEIIMHPDARLGAAGAGESAIDETMRQAYQDVASRRRTLPEAVALGMLDPALEILRVTTLEGVRYITADELPTVQEETTVSRVESIIPPAELGRFTGRELRLKFGFVSHLVDDRAALARVLGVPRRALTSEGPAREAGRALRLDLSGPISDQSVNWILRSLQSTLADPQVGLLCVVIDSPGGSHAESLRLANYLASLNPATVRTVAYVPQRALGDAALIALACDDLLIGSGAKLGGPGAAAVGARERPALHRAVRTLAATAERDWSLLLALVDPSFPVYQYAREGSGETRYFSLDELAEQDDPEQWSRQQQLVLDEGVSGQEAVRLQLASSTVDSFDAVRREYHLPPDVERLQPNWAHLLVERLASPRLAGILLFVAWFALFIEFSQPGLGIAGFIAAVCFLLFFWSNVLHGTAGWLEILLFVFGLVSLGLEIFVVPGFGVFGLGGGAMILASLVLASQTFVVPRNSYQMQQLPNSLMILVAALGGAVVAIVLVHRYFSEIPVLSRLLLTPPDEEDGHDLQEREALAHYDYLLGKRGRTATPLVPAGKARFGDDVVNVISGGDMVAAGVDVVVAEVRGNHVLVRPLERMPD